MNSADGGIPGSGATGSTAEHPAGSPPAPPVPPPSARPRRRAVLGTGLALAAGGTLATGTPLLPTPRARAADHPAAPRTGSDDRTEDADVYQELLTRLRAMLVGGAVPERYREEHASAVAAQDETARAHLDTLRVDAGRQSPWDDLPLGPDTPSANVTAVANRLRTIAVGYATEASALYGDPEAASSAAAGLAVLHRSAFHAGAENRDNWWDWEIGTPRSLGDTCALLHAAVPADTLTGLLAAVDHFVPDPTRMLRDTLVSTGANRVDLCRAVAVRGVLGAAPEKLALAAESLVGVLDPVLIGDGFHPDGSFVMHTCVAYPGTYGQVLVQGMTELMRLLAGTEWDVAEPEREATVQAVERTFVPLVHGGLMVDPVRGRAISRHHKRDADDGFLLTVDVLNLAEALPAEQSQAATRLRATAKAWLRANTFRPLAERDPVQIATAAGALADDELPAAPGLLGHFAFPDMERVVHRRPRWTYALALNSDRIARYEYMNGENATGWHTGDGMAQLYLDGDLQQYTDEFWPTVDPKRLPGLTVDTAPLETGAGGDNDHQPLTGSRWSGMVRLVPEPSAPTATTNPATGTTDSGDPAEVLALAGMELTAIDSPLTARRSWLFLDDAVLVAGSGVRANGGRRIETVVDNRSLHAPEDPRPGHLTVNGLPVPRTLGETVTHSAVRWAHLAGTGGYVFLTRGAELRSRREDRTGRWRDLNTGGPTTEVTRRYLTLWHDHGVDPDGASYAHLLLPGASFASTAARAGYPGVRVLRLDEEVHAFRTTPGALGGGSAGRRLTALTFFTAGSAAGVTVDGPCAVLLLEEGDSLRVAVSDPSRSVPVVTVDLDRRHWPRALSVRQSDERLTLLAGRPGRGPRLLAETGGSHGASLAATLDVTGRDRMAGEVALLSPVADATVRGGTHAGENDGSSPVLTVRHSPEPDLSRRSYLRFELPEAAGRVRRAVLWVRGHVPNDPATREDDMLASPLSAHGPTPGDWEESTLTWDSAPEPGPRLGGGQLTTYDDWTGLEVTEAVRRSGPGPLTLVLAQSAPGHELRLASREASADRPLLEVVTDPR